MVYSVRTGKRVSGHFRSANLVGKACLFIAKNCALNIVSSPHFCQYFIVLPSLCDMSGFPSAAVAWVSWDCTA